MLPACPRAVLKREAENVWDFASNVFDNRSRYLLLKRQYVVAVALVDSGPDLKTVRNIDQLGRNPNSRSFLPHTAFQNRRYIQLFTDLPGYLGRCGKPPVNRPAGTASQMSSSAIPSQKYS